VQLGFTMAVRYEGSGDGGGILEWWVITKNNFRNGVCEAIVIDDSMMVIFNSSNSINFTDKKEMIIEPITNDTWQRLTVLVKKINGED